MIVKRVLLKKMLQSGYVAEFNLVKREGHYEAALYLNGKFVGGPAIPQLLTSPKGELTHWMGNRPTVGLTESEAERIISEVESENEVLRHREKSGWDA
jgi:ribosomal protein S8